MKKLIFPGSLILFSCGNNDPLTPPFALTNGAYSVERVWNLADGCNRNPLNPKDPLTAGTFDVSNANGLVTIDRCLYDNKMAQGYIDNNKGTLKVYHANRQVKLGSAVAEFNQNCMLDVTVTADNTMTISFTEKQTGRNDVMRKASGINSYECNTSYNMILKKR
jgi:hypothetical protein